MAWDHLDIDKPHLAYMILGGFTGLFMLCSLFVKEKLYIGEASVATICGIIFGPHAANLFNPLSWGNVDKITLECSRIVLVVQCFAVGVELPKAYMERHWKSVTLLLLPVMTWGWLITSLFIWWMIEPLTWLEALVCSACVTATDPVLASSVVGKGKFAKRVPRHLRDLLSAESGCNDGMAFPFIYLSYYILHYRPDTNEVALHWFCITILYECIFGAIFGFTIGYVARHAIRFAERKQLIDRESFLVFYFVLALFCAGSGSLLGMDDLLIGFAAGVGFSNDGWFTEKTEESHVSNVIDLLLNLAYFVYLGAIVPWEDFNNADIGLSAWRLVVIAILVIFFRRIPIMLLLKPIIPDVKTWREALFAGHFGPIGVGAIFACILARAELETGTTQPVVEADFPKPHTHNYYIVQIIWPLTTFLVISSILVHGSSIAVFTLGKRINTLSITLSYTQANEEGPSWMNRLPRVQSLAKGSMSFRKADDSEGSSNEPEYPPGTLPPIGLPGNFLRRQQEDDTSSPIGKVSSRRARRRRRRDDGAGGPISQSAIAPLRPSEVESEDAERAINETESTPSPPLQTQTTVNVFLEGTDLIFEDKEGNVLKKESIGHMSPEQRQQHLEAERSKLNLELEQTEERVNPQGPTPGDKAEQAIGEKTDHPVEKGRSRFNKWFGLGKKRAEGEEKAAEDDEKAAEKKAANPPKGKGRSAHAYQFGNTIIVEDEDGEVIKKYSIPANDKPEAHAPVRRGLNRMGTWFGQEEEGEASQTAKKTAADEWLADDGLRFTLANDEEVGKRGVNHKGRRMTKQEFAERLRGLGPKARQSVVEETDVPERVKDVARDEAQLAEHQERRRSTPGVSGEPHRRPQDDLESLSSVSDDESDSEIPGHNVAASLARIAAGTAAEERRNDLSPSMSPLSPRQTSSRERRDSEDDGTERVPPSQLREAAGLLLPPRQADLDDTAETPAERRRRLAALGQSQESDESDDDGAIEEDSENEDNDLRQNLGKISFADGTKLEGGSTYDREGNGMSSRSHRRSSSRVSWGGEKGRDS
ncbi:Putative Sodium ion/proton exchanger (Eurofung) [Aspergillus calidoustus]|uniref:Putative Sodium ion/proton exchanger (Eurofung) n=1 Tax=Aspergillus calidoustus TaxID=454130 RepID=A0A0U5GB35_ASPCI|nr:Putative Sodium ion/proton exchanger (Eurofung) [Aspergillus calidoustus]